MKGLFIDPNADKPPPKFVSFRINEKGTPIFTVRKRKNPKYILEEELVKLAEQHGQTIKQMREWTELKKIPVLTQKELEGIMCEHDRVVKVTGLNK